MAETIPTVGYSPDCWGDYVILNALADIRGEVKDAECATKDAIMESNSQRQNAELSLHNRLCEAEKEAIKANLESRLATKETEATLLARIEECCCENEKMILALETKMNEKFCDLERRELNREIAELRQDKIDGVSGTQTSLLKSILDTLIGLKATK